MKIASANLGTQQDESLWAVRGKKDSQRESTCQRIKRKEIESRKNRPKRNQKRRQGDEIRCYDIAHDVVSDGSRTLQTRRVKRSDNIKRKETRD